MRTPMHCDRFQSALTDAAAGADASPDLCAHLTQCAACRTRLCAEQNLLAAIDSGLRTAINVDVPAHLTASVRLHIANQAVPKRWFVPTFAPLSAALLIALFATYEFHPFTAERPLRAVPANSALSAPRQTEPSRGPEQTSSIPLTFPVLPHGTSHRVVVRNAKNDDASLHVLVPRDQEPLLASYAQSWRNRKHPPLTLAQTSQSLSPVEIAPIQIDLLDVQLMADSESR